jgi:hypothetical protein
VIVWSAGGPSYVKDVASVLFRGREEQIEHLLTYDDLTDGFKDLNTIKKHIPDFDITRARLIDDNIDHSRGQEDSFILVDRFEVRDIIPTEEEDDNFLETLINQINSSFAGSSPTDK